MLEDHTSAPKADALPGCATPRAAEARRFPGDSAQAVTDIRGNRRRNAAGTGEGSPELFPDPHPWVWPDRFWRKVAKGDGCWLWLAARQSVGYGHIWLDGRMRLAHRVAYEEVIGLIPDGMTVDHLCRVRHCVNPAHMELVTLAENIARSENVTAINARKTTCPRGHALVAVKDGKRAGERYCPSCNAERRRLRPLSMGVV